MKVILMPVGSAGDVHPLVGLGLKLRDRGHEVILASNGHFADLADRIGMPFEEVGSDAQYRTAINDPRLWTPGPTSLRFVLDMSLLVMRRQYELLAAHAATGPIAVVAGVLAFGTRVAQDKFGFPLATVQLAPASLPSSEQPPKMHGLFMPGWMPMPFRRAVWRMVDWVTDRFMADEVNRLRHEVGLPPCRRLFTRWWNSPTRVLGMFPDWLAGRPSDWPAQVALTGFPLYDEGGATPMPAPLVEFLERGDPPIVFTPGSAMTLGEDFFRTAVHACTRLGRRAVLLTRFPGQLPATLPPGVIHADFAPLGELLPRAAAMVHHGGIGTTAQAFAAGVPQLVMPMAHDQFDNAHHVRRLGTGDWLARRRFKPAPVAATLDRLLSDPTVAASCRAVADRIDRPAGLTAACDVLENDWR